MNSKSIIRRALWAVGIAGFCTAANASEIDMTLPSLIATPFAIDSFSWVLHTLGGGGQTSTVSDFTFTRPVDSATPALFSAALNGTNLPTGTVEVCYPNCSLPKKETLITFTNAFIVSESISGSSENPTETFTLAFTKVTTKYTGDGSQNDNLRELHPWTVLIPPTAPSGPGAPTDQLFTETLDALDLLSGDQFAPGGLGASLPDSLDGTNPAAVPLPASAWLLLGGLGGLGIAARRRRPA